MINSANDADSFIKEVQAISAVDPFACRIISLCNSYKPDLVFVDYWLVQNDSGNMSLSKSPRIKTLSRRILRTFMLM